MVILLRFVQETCVLLTGGWLNKCLTFLRSFGLRMNTFTMGYVTFTVAHEPYISADGKIARVCCVLSACACTISAIMGMIHDVRWHTTFVRGVIGRITLMDESMCCVNWAGYLHSALA